jgi:hypothetical protein
MRHSKSEQAFLCPNVITLPKLKIFKTNELYFFYCGRSNCVAQEGHTVAHASLLRPTYNLNIINRITGGVLIICGDFIMYQTFTMQINKKKGGRRCLRIMQ